MNLDNQMEIDQGNGGFLPIAPYCMRVKLLDFMKIGGLYLCLEILQIDTKLFLVLGKLGREIIKNQSFKDIIKLSPK